MIQALLLNSKTVCCIEFKFQSQVTWTKTILIPIQLLLLTMNWSCLEEAQTAKTSKNENSQLLCALITSSKSVSCTQRYKDVSSSSWGRYPVTRVQLWHRKIRITVTYLCRKMILAKQLPGYNILSIFKLMFLP